ncbi:DUF4178 domain-containing protein [Sphingomonas pokkalii]|uniref:DUF4178 domain-containing protein n=1 Tax=Sphingomonas pokkalii TaxID=2175090 RepID=A0A2U0SDL3_9SPHN|nr:DUF4178 domain-containing protein [Sphingomonas pokkalii]PVX29381.1 DUF4178 domain-containing protein [Sphingomonas pokkalii]
MQPEASLSPPPAPAVRALSCPNCGGTVELRAAGYTVHVGCQYCGSILDATDGLAKLVIKAQTALAYPEIPLGTRGTLFDVEWEAIGYLQRSQNGAYRWDEYLLFNPYHGYRWLVNARGGWSFGTMLTRVPTMQTFSTYALEGTSYTRFFRGDAQVDRVVGEFYWRVAVGETVKTGDWVRPGFMLSREANDREISWTINQWLPERDVVAAFGVTPAAKVWPPLPHQPSPWGAWLGKGARIGGIALAFLLLVSLLLSGTRWLASEALPVAVDGREQSATIGPVHLVSRWQRVRVRTTVPRLENGWVDLDYSLIDRRNQQVYAASGAAERYEGVDSDGPWTEGSRDSDVSIAGVPAGDYDLIVEYKGNRWSQNDTAYPDGGWMEPTNAPQIVVELGTGTLYAGNFLLALLLIAFPWFVGLMLHLRFEKARKEQSDFAPAASGDGDD